MELTQLRYFLEVAKNQHITKSAENLHISQPSLTQAIHRLENELETELFTHMGRNIYLTPCGEHLYKRLKEAFFIVDSLKEELKEIKGMESRKINLNVLAASATVTEAVINYKKIHPDVVFELSKQEDYLATDIQITATAFGGFSKDKNYEYKMFSEEIYVAVSSYGKYKDYKSIALKELENDGFVFLSGSERAEFMGRKYCKDAGFTPNIIFRSDSPISIINMVGADIGICFWPSITWGTPINKHVSLLRVKSRHNKEDFVVALRKGREKNPLVRDFYNFLLDFIQEKIYEYEKNIV